MPNEPNPFRRGGMDPNPFGGEDRIDRINLMEYLEPNAVPDKVLYSRIIQDAASNYLYAFLGKNGTSPKEFFAAWQYFFKVASYDRESWNHHRTIKHSYTQKSQRVVENRYLTDSELQLMCFDKHYELSGLEDYMNINRFKSGLIEKRRKILRNNWDQVVTYIHALYQHELSQIAEGHQLPIQVWSEDLERILVDPPTPYHLASIIYVQSRLKRTPRARAKKPVSTIGIYAKLAERLQNNKVPALPEDWGPIASLLRGADDVQVADNNGSDSICCDLNRFGAAS